MIVPQREIWSLAGLRALLSICITEPTTARPSSIVRTANPSWSVEIALWSSVVHSVQIVMHGVRRPLIRRSDYKVVRDNVEVEDSGKFAFSIVVAGCS